VQDLRKRFGGPLIANDGFGTVTTREDAQRIVEGGLADLVAVGRNFIANPDLVRRWQTGAELNTPDADTFYSGGPRGYIDYPFLEG
jgi:2,4-dienoyl-CoA reductase-like NADH-dependent reductase (Old Yellow Enzyme family)